MFLITIVRTFDYLNLKIKTVFGGGGGFVQEAHEK